jgi:CDP-diacylglycerol--glycerol-3-phosphate 3-phosphatidyltransferase
MSNASRNVEDYGGHSFCASSANLNKSYFTDRQDRYLLFSGQSNMAEYCFSYLKTASSFSFKLSPSPTAGLNAAPVWIEPSLHPERIEPYAAGALRALQSSYMHGHGLPPPTQAEPGEALIFPIIQAGQFGIREEEECMELLFRHLLEAVEARRTSRADFSPLVNLTSGYFGLYRQYQDLILQTPIDTRIVCASPLVCVLSCLDMVQSADRSFRQTASMGPKAYRA